MRKLGGGAVAALALLALLVPAASARTTKLDLIGFTAGEFLGRGDSLWVLARNFLPRSVCKRKAKFRLTDSAGDKFRLKSRRPRFKDDPRGQVYAGVGDVPAAAAAGRATLRSKQKCRAGSASGRERFTILADRSPPKVSNRNADDVLTGRVSTLRFRLDRPGYVHATIEYELFPDEWRSVDVVTSTSSIYGNFYSDVGAHKLRWRADIGGRVPAGHYRFALTPRPPATYGDGGAKPSVFVDFYVAEPVGQGRFQHVVDAQLSNGGRLVAPDPDAGDLKVFSAFGALEGTLGVGLAGPKDVAFAPDDGMFVAESGGGRIARLAADGTVASTFGAGRFSPAQGPQGVATTDADGGRVYVADGDQPEIERFDFDGNPQPPITGNGLDDPISVAAAPDGSIWVSDPGAPESLLHFGADGALLHRVPLADSFGVDVARSGRVIATHRGWVSIFGPSGTRIGRAVGAGGLFERPNGVAAAGLSGDFYAVDSGARRLLHLRDP